jgi:hypothetical protein
MHYCLTPLECCLHVSCLALPCLAVPCLARLQGGFQYYLYNNLFVKWCAHITARVGHRGSAPIKTFIDQAIQYVAHHLGPVGCCSVHVPGFLARVQVQQQQQQQHLQRSVELRDSCCW